MSYRVGWEPGGSGASLPSIIPRLRIVAPDRLSSCIVGAPAAGRHEKWAADGEGQMHTYLRARRKTLSLSRQTDEQSETPRTPGGGATPSRVVDKAAPGTDQHRTHTIIAHAQHKRRETMTLCNMQQPFPPLLSSPPARGPNRVTSPPEPNLPANPISCVRVSQRPDD